MDTIYALSTGSLPCAIAIIRISGPKVKEILLALVGVLPKARFMHYGALYDRVLQENKDQSFFYTKGLILDHALTVFFPNPHSFTGEDCAEFHLHGGKAVIEGVLKALSTFETCRQAEAGEFSKRAFLNQKMDLSQAEGLADLLDAETEAQRRLALTGVQGELAHQYRQWRQILLEARAFCEMVFDFSEEEDIATFNQMIWYEKLESLQKQLRYYIHYGQMLARLRDGLKIVIIGAPNCGKSSFINALAKRQVALVSEEAGTTRDIIEISLIIAGHKVIFSDTAGIRDTTNGIEKLGIEQALKCVQEADLLLHLEDLVNPTPISIDKEGLDYWKIGTKLDLLDQNFSCSSQYKLCVSVQKEIHMVDFFEHLEHYVEKKCEKIGDPLPARQRQIDLLKGTLEEIELALKYKNLGLEFSAEHLRRSSDYLGRLTGDVDVENLLDIIFSKFCIGK